MNRVRACVGNLCALGRRRRRRRAKRFAILGRGGFFMATTTTPAASSTTAACRVAISIKHGIVWRGIAAVELHIGGCGDFIV